jgi:nitrile hydratase subunit beta
MNGVHDMGGMHGFGPVVREEDEPVFHAAWEGKVRALMGRTRSAGYYNLDEFRHAIERMPAEDYLRAGYYERWLHSVETLLLEKGVITADELVSGRSSKPAAAPRARPKAPTALVARFKRGDRVVTRKLNPEGHTRLPRYARGRTGVVRTVNGPFLLPDSSAHGRGPDWQACYAVEFSARELWGETAPAGDRVCVDLWESYLVAEPRK